MTNTEIKEKAQHDLLAAMQTAFSHISENYDTDDAEAIKAEASKQMARVENIFGYERFSWTRGC